MEVSRTAIPERRVAIPKDVLPTVSGANSGAPKLKLPEVVIVPQVAVPVPNSHNAEVQTQTVQEDPQLLALRREMQPKMQAKMQARRSAQSRQVGAMPNNPPPPQNAAQRKIALRNAKLARDYGKTIQEVESARAQAKRLGMSTEDFLDQIAQAAEMVPARAKREVKQVVPFASVQHLYTKGRFHGWKDCYDREYCGL